jgi:RNA polymerase sigma-70 factor (ECF subfamily)
MEQSSPEPTPDGLEMLLAQARAGDMEALGKAFCQAERLLRRRAARYIPRDLQARREAADLVQDTFLLAVQAFQDFRGTTAKEFVVWLYHILVNHATDLRRRFAMGGKRDTHREVRLSDPSATSNRAAALLVDRSSPSNLVENREQTLALYRALEQLPEQYQQVLELRMQNDLSFEAIGRLLYCSAEAARKRYVRALAALSCVLETGIAG